MKKRIVISGASGTGKTTLAKWLSKQYDIPFMSTSAKPLWPKHNITTHAELVEKTLDDPKWGIEFQFELLSWREQMLVDIPQYVSDRGPLDNIVYFLSQCSQNATKDLTENYINRALSFVSNHQTHQIMLAFSDEIPIQEKGDDGMRITNPYYQYMIDSIFERVIGRYFPQTKTPTLVIGYWDLAERKDSVLKFLSNLLIPGVNGKG